MWGHVRKATCLLSRRTATGAVATLTLGPKEGHDVFARLDVAVAVHPHINIRKLVEILQRILQTPEQTLHETQYECHAAVVVPVPRALHHGPDRLNDGHQERPKADTAKGGGGGTNKGVLDGGGAAGGGVNGGEPPGGDHAGNGDMDGVLEGGNNRRRYVRGTWSQSNAPLFV